MCTVDGATHRGALSAADGETVAAAATTALAERLPFVLVMASSGAEVGDGVPALHGWGRAARALVQCSGVVPLVFAITGPAVSGPALLLGLADLVVMCEDAYTFVSGPRVVAELTGVPVTNLGLGGAGVHARRTGVAAVVVRDAEEAWTAIGDILTLLPANLDELPPRFSPPTQPIEQHPKRPMHCPPRRPAATTYATSSAPSSTMASCSSCGPDGRATS